MKITKMQPAMKTNVRNVARKVVNVKKELPKGIAKTPVRFMDKDTETTIKMLVGGTVGVSAVTSVLGFSSDFSIGFSEGFSMYM